MARGNADIMDDVSFKRLADAYDTLLSMSVAKGFKYLRVEPNVETIQLELMDLNAKVYQWQSSLPKIHDNPLFPPGNWYMVTVTNPADKDKAWALSIHDKALEYFEEQKIEVWYAVLEKSNIFHTHYVCRFPHYVKNEARGLKAACMGQIVRIEKKVRNLHQWNGLCKYVMKKDYDKEKADTHLETLISRIAFNEGLGYQLEAAVASSTTDATE